MSDGGAAPIENAVAIVGLACRLPGARNPEEFWRNLCAGVESIARFNDSELEDSFSDEVRHSANFVKARPILTGIEDFDAEFFGMHAREAELTDPQQRVFLECAWEALESAGYDPARYRGAIGVFAGSSLNSYFLRHVCADRRSVEEFTSSYQVGCYPELLGAGLDFLATRVSYKLDLKGPSVAVASACSTSLLAVAQACQSLLLYQADMALAGGVSISLPQKRGYLHQAGGMVSADGHCRAFDAEASGTVFGSGAGVVLLKRLEDALADGDHVYAVIRGCGINNDGARKVGFTAPSVEAQAAAIELAHANAGVDARTIGYVECHGTATPLGDPIEIAALTQAFRRSTDERQFCAIGSAKTNIGHLDVAAGVVGLIKTALALERRALPPSLHFERPNPQIPFEASPFFVNTALRPWQASQGPRRAGVSAFGVGGTNVHVVLEEAPLAASVETHALRPDYQLLVLSARSEAALRSSRQRLAAHLQQHPEAALSDVAAVLQLDRRAFERRGFAVCRDRDAAIERLNADATIVTAPKSAPPVAFMFPGQGSQYVGMARDLYEREAVFRQHFDECAAFARPLLETDLAALLYGTDTDGQATARLTATSIAQPAIFAVEYALARLWMSLGIVPDSMIGHSVGEFVAAVLSEVMHLQDAVRIVAARGRLMQALPPGAMLAVRLPEASLLPLLPDAVTIAAVNAPSLCVASGPPDAIAALESVLEARAVASRRLHTSHAFHSPMIDPIVEPLRAEIARIALSAPKRPYISTVTGQWIRDDEATSADYWARHARATVRFADAVNCLSSREVRPLLLEVGPGNALSTLALQTLVGSAPVVVTSMQDAKRERDDRECWLEALGQLWVHGAQPDWSALHPAGHARVPLPTYPFERKRHWIEAPRLARQPDGRQSTLPPPTVTIAAAETSQALAQEPATMTPPNPSKRTEQLSRLIAGILEELSGEAPTALEAPVTFLEMGYDSLFLTQVAQKLQSQTKVKVTFRQLLTDYPSIPALAAFLAEKMPPEASPPATAAAPAMGAAIPSILVSSTPMPAELTSPPAAGSAPSGLEAVLREQLQTLSQLFARQFEMLQTLAAPRAVAAAPLSLSQTPASMPAPTPAPAAPSADSAAGTSQPSRFQVYKPTQQSSAGLAPEHRRHIEELAARYGKRTARSKQYTQEHRGVLADPRAASGFRSEWKELVYPLVVDRSVGSKLWDLDGNEYIDLVNGYGQTAFGHAPEFVVRAVKEQLDHGFAIGPQSELAGKVAALFAEMTGAERVTFCNTGSEAVMAAMRVARTVTGRERIVIFNGDYHGQFDEVLVKGVQRPGAAPRSTPVAPGIPASAAQNMVVLEYGTDATLHWIREHAAELAAVIVEPVQSRHPDLRPFDFLRELRNITAAAGTVFVLDEVVTGFRVHPAGIQGLTGIRADLATYGKVVGGGLPIGILAGKAQFMDALDGGQWRYGDDSIPEVGVTFFAGTFVRHPLALAATRAVLEHLKAQGPALQQRLSERTAALAEQLRRLFAEFALAARIEHFASWFYFHVHNDGPLAGLLFHHLRLRGIHIQDGFPCFLTTAHSDEDIERIVAAFRDSLTELRSVGIIGGAGRNAPADPVASGTAPLTPANANGTEAEAGAAQSNLPLTESQTEVWLTAQRGDEASCAFNESVTLRLHGSLNEDALRRAAERVFARHDALRVRFAVTGEHMHVDAASGAPWTVIDVSGRRAAEAESTLQDLIAQDARQPFNLVAGPVARFQLVKLGAQEHALIFTAHHIVCDGWSINVIIGELTQIYAALCRGESLELPAPLPFSRYALDEAARQASETAGTEAYWLEQFREPIMPLELPTDRPRPALKTYHGASRCRRIDAKLYQAAKRAGGKAGHTLFVTLLGAFQALIGRLCEQQEVIVGVPTAGQSLLDDQILVGHCVNFLPIRARWEASTTLAEHLRQVAKRVLDAYEHQNYTLGALVRKLSLQRSQNRVPLAEIQFNLERLADKIQLAGLQIEVEPNAKACVNFDLFLNVIESNDGLRLDCDYNTDLFDRATIDRWLDCYQTLLETLIAEPSQPLVRARYLPAAELQRVLHDYNQTASDYPRSLAVHELFEARVASQPDAIAASSGDERLSYRELDGRANQLARILLQRIGAGEAGAADRLVGVAADRSIPMLVALLAVLKAGCAYVPLDPTHPSNRLRYILADAGVAALITDDAAIEALLPPGLPTIHLQRDATLIGKASQAALPRRTAIDRADRDRDRDRLSYVIYTSGSTGEPKGVEVTHRAVVNFLSSMQRSPGLCADDVLLAVTTVSFDIAGLELFLPLHVGAQVVIASRDELTDGFALLDRLRRARVTAIQATPATWRLLLEAGFRSEPGFKMLCGGEALPRDLANELLGGGGELWNMYGPTETTIWSTCERVNSGADPITVGGPIANTQCYLLDRNDQPVLAGSIGQLHIAGDGLARGYHRRPELTSERFIANPFATGRMYRTGDLARWLPSGQLQILGRIDHQVKLRGFRIELGEIEAAITALPGISSAAVALRTDHPGTPRLVAYYVQSGPEEPAPARMRDALAERLPDYMVPSAWVRLDRLPTTPNGKLDRAALPAPESPAEMTENYRAPAGPLEESLAKIYGEVLHLPRVSTDADLLHLGADSIQLFQITARANRAGIKLTAKQLLQHRTIMELAGVLTEGAAQSSAWAPADPALPSLNQFRRTRRSTNR